MSLQDLREASCLAITYGFLPTMKCRPTGRYQVPAGKFEADKTPAAATRTMVLAHWWTHSNLLIKYRPAELQI